MYSKVTHHAWLYYLVIFINYNTYFRLTPFSDIHISQGSVATCLRHGEIFKLDFVANLPPSPSVKKKLENRLIFGEVTGKSLVSCFLNYSVYIT